LARYSVVVEGRTRIFLAGGLCIETPHGLLLERAFPGRQARHCFARLVGARGRPVSREELADELWPGDLPGAWETALRAIVSKLRTVLGGFGVAGASISAVSGSYQLDLPANVWVDIDAAADAIHRAEAALARGGTDVACGWSLAARAISSRPLLPGLDGPWLELERGHLDDIRVRALSCLVEVWIRQADASLAARDALEALRLDPLREISHRLLIRAHLAAGDRGAAIKAYERCRRILGEELGVVPSPETAALVAGVRLRPERASGRTS
jgi:DNA-binding SARP family transcriptional activator